MNYSYEITCTSPKKKSIDTNKYFYKSNQSIDRVLLFEIILKRESKDNILIRKIIKSNQGNLISSDDNILYNEIDKVKINIIEINNLKNIYELKGRIDHESNFTSIINKDFYIEFNNIISGQLTCSFNVINSV